MNKFFDTIEFIFKKTKLPFSIITFVFWIFSGLIMLFLPENVIVRLNLQKLQGIEMGIFFVICSAILTCYLVVPLYSLIKKEINKINLNKKIKIQINSLNEQQIYIILLLYFSQQEIPLEGSSSNFSILRGLGLIVEAGINDLESYSPYTFKCSLQPYIKVYLDKHINDYKWMTEKYKEALEQNIKEMNENES